MPITILPNMPVTSDAINELRMNAWEDAGPAEWDPVLERSLGWVCAVDGERLVGFVNVAWDGGSHAFLLDTTVHREYQHRGIGTALVKEAVEIARSVRADWLHVDYDEELEPFYRGCGFKPTAAGLINLSPE
ncbi:MAG: GNAT family N-acetyltransferase [Chloroflexia bacterium]